MRPISRLALAAALDIARRRVAAAALMAGAALLAAAALGCTQGRAADSVTCTAYANEAVAAANEVINRGCDYDLKHPQWSTDFNAHMRWCRFAEQSSVDQEKANRASQLNHCRSCAEYADKAVRTAGELNKIKVCTQNPADPRWSTDPAAHRRWCLHTDADSIKKEVNARDDERFYCLRCSNYAQTAVNQYERARSCLGSAPSGQQWSSRTTDHYYWCRDWYGSGNETEEAKREKEITGFCTQSTKGGLSKSTSSTVVPRRVDPARRKSESKNSSIENTVRAANPCQPGQVNDPCKSKSRALSPGLLEGGGGFATQGPSATGARASSPAVAPAAGTGAGQLR